MSTFAIIAGGGTAGHVVPGLAIAQELVARGVPTESVRYVGSSRGIETRLVPDAGFPLAVLPGRGIQRKLALANVGAIFGLIAAVIQGIVLVGRARPAVVVGLGGYASVPCVLGAVLWRVPIVVTEQNAVPSAANRLAARFAAAVAVPFPGAPVDGAIWTGNPVRPAIVAVNRATDRASARARLDVKDDQMLLVVMGGSLGARRINDALFEALADWRNRADLVVHHIAGARDHDDLAARIPLSERDPLDYRLIRYEDDMASVYTAADLALCRAGASTVAELAVVGLPSVLIPLPGAPGDHQTANARALEQPGGAVRVVDGDLDGPRLIHEVDALIAEPELLRAMSDGARSVGRADAAAAIADLVQTHARRPAPGGSGDS